PRRRLPRRRPVARKRALDDRRRHRRHPSRPTPGRDQRRRAPAGGRQHRGRRAGLMREYLLVFMTAFAVTYLLAVVARALAMRFGAFGRVRARDVHEVPIPYFGGVAMFGGLVAATLVASKLPFLGHSPDRAHIFHDARAILLGGAVICLVGVVDDIY